MRLVAFSRKGASEPALGALAGVEVVVTVSRMLARATGVDLTGDAVCRACRQSLPHGDAVCRTCHAFIALVPAVVAVEPRVRNVLADACQVWRRYRNSPPPTRVYERHHTYLAFKDDVSSLVGWGRRECPPDLPPKAYDIVMDVVIALLPPDKDDYGDDP